MFRSSSIALFAFTAFACVACSNPYRRMYSPQRSYFKPDKNVPKGDATLTPTPITSEVPVATPPAPPVEMPPPGL